MNENFRKLYEQSNYSAVGFSQIIGVSRQRFYRIINNKKFRKMRIIEFRAQRIDWYLSGDDGEDSLVSRLKSELELLNENKI